MIIFLIGFALIIFLGIRFKHTNFNHQWLTTLFLTFIFSFFIPKWGYLQRAEIFTNKYKEYSQHIIERYSYPCHISIEDEFEILEKYTDIKNIELIDSQTVLFQGSNGWFSQDEYIVVSYNDIIINSDSNMEVVSILQEETSLLSGSIQRIKKIQDNLYYINLMY